MGVEYAHYLVVRDPNWIGDVDVARRVHAVLDHWQLVSGDPELFELNGGHSGKLLHRLADLTVAPPNLLVRYPHLDGRAVAAVMGPSYYASATDDDRYFQRISLVLGTDFRIGPNSEALGVRVVRPPVREGREVAAYSDGSHLWEFYDSYPADADTLPPVTRVDSRGDLPAGFTGAWRAGLILDCGKNLPRIDGWGFGVRVSAPFEADLETAFGTPLIEVGKVY
jgi:hypothetical protein